MSGRSGINLTKDASGLEIVTAYSDGSADNRKGVKNGGWGAVVMCGNHKVERYGGSYINTTSARMEIRGLLEVMRMMKRPVKLTVHIDNQYVVNTIAKGWLFRWMRQGILHEKANSDLWELVFEEFKRLGGHENVQLKWVKGHNGHTHNERADDLAALGRSLKQTIDCRTES